jgi:hypothetical protein
MPMSRARVIGGVRERSLAEIRAASNLNAQMIGAKLSASKFQQSGRLMCAQ